MFGKFPPLLVLALTLAACGGDGDGARVKSISAKPPLSHASNGFQKLTPSPLPKPLVHSLPGLEGVIGAAQPELVRRFGMPRLDVWEGAARKLQFSGAACVLDVYLYPVTAGNAPQATYVEARRASDGREVDRASCVAALGKAPNKPER